MTTYLLDVNLLLALSDPMHLHHEAAHRWFITRGQASWATCPLTENGFVRVASHPSYPNRPGDTPLVIALLRQLCLRTGHNFWPASVSLRDILLPGALLTHNHITDVYLLGLAQAQGGKLATFDQRLPATAIRSGERALELLAI
ncbi:type II toxin-antitoxin system VapC family toxin [Candidatus Gracilibacteria bacterium]|nr:type II toxin-antitoxin system VapC family toxin [Candidatus Gracilibacteria bacterium]NJO84340.1 type II toxin-antitoxin system VapC family toxin [Blastochloris sp.]